MLCLKIELENVRFAKKGHNFIKVELKIGNDLSPLNHRTEVSAKLTRPLYKNRVFKFSIDPSEQNLQFKIIFTLFNIEKGDGDPQVDEVGTGSIIIDECLVNPKKISNEMIYFFGNHHNKVGEANIYYTFCILEEQDGSTSGYAQFLLARSLLELDRPSTGSETLDKDKQLGLKLPAKREFSPVDQIYEESLQNFRDLHSIQVCQSKNYIKENHKEPSLNSENLERNKNDSFMKEKNFVEEEKSPYISGMGLDSSGQKLLIMVHDIWDLPMMVDASTDFPHLPQPFVTIKTSNDACDGAKAKAATHVSTPACEASFGEILMIEFQHPYSISYKPSIFITVADNLTKKFLAKFTLPISCEQFLTHRQVSVILRSISSSVQVPSPQLRLSVTSIDSTIHSPFTLQREYDMKTVFLEFVLRGILKSSLPFPVRCYAVVKIVRSGSQYVAMLKAVQRRFGVIEL
ncbi:hypothetical protein HK096_005549 [Nowakowskiella sp. JEL0078]|nr:hypothetical protein HK096_005549 [Nowakowskiella sp. JEL0078]